MMDKVYIVDLAKYQTPGLIPWAEWVARGVRMGIAKASMGGGYDPVVDLHVADMKEGGADVGIYHWCDPLQNFEKQAHFFLDKIFLHSPDVIAFDVEQWWADWSLWIRYIRGEIPKSAVPVLSEQRIIDNYCAITEIVESETDYHFEDRSIAYSADWFLDMYPGVTLAIKDYKQWMAYYCYAQRKKITWDQLYQAPPDDVSPGGRPYDIWQFADCFILPGVDFVIDTNLWEGTVESYKNWLNKVDEPEPEPLPPDVDEVEEFVQALEGAIGQVRTNPDDLDDIRVSLCEEIGCGTQVDFLYEAMVTAYALNVRQGPGVHWKVVRTITRGTVVQVYEVDGYWARISEDDQFSEEWCSLNYLLEA